MFTKLQAVKNILSFRERGLSLVAQYSFTTAAPTGEKRRSQFQKYTNNANRTYISPQRHEIRMNSEDLRHILNQKNSKEEVEADLYWKGYNEGTSRALISKHSYLGERQKLDEILQRDITLLVMQQHIEMLKQKPKYEPLNILLVNPESGIKAMRILKELSLPDINNLILAGTNKAFPEFVKVNSIANQLTPEQQSKMKCLLKDPKEVMFESRSFLPKDSGKYKYQIIDIECTGSSLPYVDQAIQALDQDGLLCLTFTDLKVLTGSDYQKAYYYYGSTISKTDSTHENGIRIAYHAVNNIANKSFKSITPVFSYFEDFYFRLYLRVNNNKTACSHSIIKTGNVLTCSKCPSYKVLPLGVENTSWKGEKLYTATPLPKGSDSCGECGSPNFLNGPIWIDPINDFDFVKDIYTKTSTLNAEEAKKQYFSFEKVQGLLYAMLKEREFSKIPLNVNFEAIAGFLQLKSKPNKFLLKNAYANQNYKITRSYLYRNLWKTDAPLSVAFDLLKFWRRNGEAKEIQDPLEEGSVAETAMKKPIKHFPNFRENIALNENSESVGQDQDETVKIPTPKDEDKALFFQKPTPTWGTQKRVVIPKKPKNEEEKK